MKKRQIIIVFSAVIIFGGSFGLSQWLAEQKEEPEKEKPVEKKKYVKTLKVEYTDILTQVVAYGRTQSVEELDIIPEVSGRMYQGKITLKEGYRFHKGDLLVTIDDKEAKLRLQSQVSTFLKDLAAIAPDLKIDYKDRYEVWFNYYSSIEIDRSLPPLPKISSQKEKTFLATKNILSSYYTIKSQEENLRKYKFYAPFDGSITKVNLQSGSFVNQGSNIARIVRTDKIEMTVDVPLKDVSWIRRGEKVTIATEDGTKTWEGTVSRIGDIVNPQTQSIDVYLDIKNENQRVYGGQYLKAIIPGEKVKDAIELPRNILVDASHVYLVEDSLLKRVEINVHKVNAETVVFNGIPEGADLVIEQLINASNNMKVYKLSENGKDIDLENKNDASVAANN